MVRLPQRKLRAAGADAESTHSVRGRIPEKYERRLVRPPSKIGTVPRLRTDLRISSNEGIVKNHSQTKEFLTSRRSRKAAESKGFEPLAAASSRDPRFSSAAQYPHW